MVLEGTSGMTESQFDAPEFRILKSEPFFGDLGYSLPIPWPLVHTAGYWEHGTIPTEKKLIFRSDPEYFATNGKIRSNNGLKTINTSDPIYSFQRSDFTVPVYDSGATPEKYLARKRRDDEKEFRRVARI